MRRINTLLLSVLLTSSLQGRALSLQEAKLRNPEVKRLLKEATGDEKEWVEWLLRDMPTIDLITLDADSFLLDLKALHTNLDSLPWGKTIPQEIFQRYVLPYRVSQEPLEYFRLHYRRELYGRVRDCPDVKSAALSINEWAYEQMKYEPTSRWDQSAEVTIKRGIGRCEEMSILFMKACRAVGIPVRMVSTPYWPFTNSNHAWVEVRTEDKWHFLGGAEMTPLDGAWFRESVRRTAIVKGIAWGEFLPKDEIVYYKGNGYTVLNLTPNYGDTTGLSVTVRNSNGAPVESANIWVSVFNYSSIRRVAHKYTDDSGKAHIVVGKCDLFVSCGKDSLWDYEMVRLTDTNSTTRVLFTLKRTTIPDTSFWLRVKGKETVPRDTTYKPLESSYAIHDLRQAQLTAVDPEVLEELPDSSFETRLLKNLNRSRGNRETLLKFWRGYEENRDLLLSLWDVMHTKDLIASDSSLMQEIIDASIKRRRCFDYYGFPDSLFFEYVANPRILWEEFGVDYPVLEEIFIELVGRPQKEVADGVVRYIRTKIDTLSDKNYFGGTMNPYQTLAAGTGSSIERLLLFVGAMRAVGIPARIGWDHKGAEYYDNDWVSVTLDTSEEEKTREVVIAAKFTQNGKRRTDVRYYYDFSMCRLEDGVFEDLTPPMDTSQGIVFFTVSPGEYCFVTGWRGSRGNVFVRILPVEAEEDTVFTEVLFGLPPAEAISPFDLVVRDFNGLSLTDVRDIEGHIPSKSDWQRGDVIVAFFDPEEEASISTAKSLASVSDVPFLILVKATGRARAVQFCRENKLSGRIFFGGKEDLKKILNFREFPSILLLRDGKAVLWTEGLTLEIANMIKQLRH